MIKIIEKDFNIDEEIKKIKDESIGAIVTFLGTVRGFSGEKRVERLEFEIYKEMATQKFEEIEEVVKKKFDIKKVIIIHRIGKLNVTENIVLIGIASSHRKPAFRACEFIIDELKKIVPIWKKEITKDEEYWK